MRDPNRIRRIMDALERAWCLVPDWRFYQLIYNITRDRGDQFYTEDNVLLERLGRFIKEHDKGSGGI